MQRVPEPELMDDQAQAAAYAAADFSEAHSRIIAAFESLFPRFCASGRVLDLGCGPGDIGFRFAARYPACRVLGVDGAAAMLAHARRRKAGEAQLGRRVDFLEGLLPGAAIPAVPYAAIISNSLLHHLHDPDVLWQTVAAHAQPGTCIFVADLMRPPNSAMARQLVDRHAAGEPGVLRRDFYHSLCAAFEPAEVEAQLRAAGLPELAVDIISDRHLVVHGQRR